MGLVMKYLPDITISKFNPDDLNDSLKPQLMEIEERCFHPDIQEDWEGKQALIKSSKSCFFAYDKGKIIGESYTVAEYEPEDDSDDSKHMIEIMKRCKEENGIYGYSIGVLPEYEGKDIAKRLKIKTLMDSKRQGYKKCFLHAKQGASSHLQKFFEGQLITERHNWFDTGNTHYLYKITFPCLFLIDNFEPYIQETGYDCGLASIESLLNYNGIKIDRKLLVESSGINNGDGIRIDGMVKALKTSGKEPIQISDTEELFKNILQKKPCIIQVLSPGCYEGHYLTVVGHGKSSFYVQDVCEGKFGRLSMDELEKVWWTNPDPYKWGITL